MDFCSFITSVVPRTRAKKFIRFIIKLVILRGKQFAKNFVSVWVDKLEQAMGYRHIELEIYAYEFILHLSNANLAHYLAFSL